jgi:purine catabolism regulator
LSRRASPAHAAWVERLANAGLVGIGFGTGLSHARVPAGIVAAAESHDFPLLEVPLETPFIAVTKAVWTALAADEHDRQEKSYRAQLELTREARGPDAQPRLLAVLARELGAWVMLVDGAGTLLHAAPAGAGEHVAAVRAQSRQLRESGNRGIVIGAIGDDEVVVQALRDGDRGTSLLAVGRPTALSTADRNVLNTAVSLLAVAGQETTAVATVDARLRAAVLRLLLAGGYVDGTCQLAEQLDVAVPAGPTTLAVVLGQDRQLAALARAVERAASGDGEPVLLDTDRHGRLVLLMAGRGHLCRQLPGLIKRVPGLAAGTAATASLRELPGAFRDADHAARAGRRRGATLTDVADVGHDGLLALVNHADGRAFAESLLRPLLLHDASFRGDLVQSLWAWLEHNGHWDAAAAQLGVHRHTLRHRIRKVAGLLGRDLDSPGTRMELWAALEIRAQQSEAAAVVPGD